ncbi:MAG: hypothetical protein F4045_02525 [Chloroflexi bacterium]|nr:hypothetical protein [Chloroflexota bacterium]MYK34003.1 hypothetical protein [Chloroflexota bacterium]
MEITPRWLFGKESAFTRWLSENLGNLASALQMDLRLVRREAPVSIGSRKLDILATDDEDRRIGIENQIKETNDRHLGSILVYAAGCDLDVMIWIATEFKDEHLRELHRLNQHSYGETEFYGVEMRMVNSDGTRPVKVQFNVVVKPGMAMPSVSAVRPALTTTDDIAMTDTITILVSRNPHKGTPETNKRHARFDLLEQGMTVGKYFSKGGHRRDIKRYLESGWITLSNHSPRA